MKAIDARVLTTEALAIDTEGVRAQHAEWLKAIECAATRGMTSVSEDMVGRPVKPIPATAAAGSGANIPHSAHIPVSSHEHRVAHARLEADGFTVTTVYRNGTNVVVVSW